MFALWYFSLAMDELSCVPKKRFKGAYARKQKQLHAFQYALEHAPQGIVNQISPNMCVTAASENSYPLPMLIEHIDSSVPSLYDQLASKVALRWGKVFPFALCS
uniref:Uncharacterized protein n=1 Tax=Anopheles minimus TaxID=112268 RepID=A0A182WB31_9DIPT